MASLYIYICSKGFLHGLIFGGAQYWRKFCVSKWVGVDSENSLKHQENILKQLTMTQLTVTKPAWQALEREREGGIARKASAERKFGGGGVATSLLP